MFEVGKNYRIVALDFDEDGHPIQALIVQTVVKVALPLIQVMSPYETWIINTHAPTFSEAILVETQEIGEGQAISYL